MTGPAYLADLASRKGWIAIDYDQTVWIPCPRGFDEMPPEEWSGRFAQTWWNASGIKHGKRELRRFEQMLITIQQKIYAEQPCHFALLHIPDVRYPPLSVAIGIWRSAGDRDTQLRHLVHADERVAIERPVVEEAWTENLGTGLRSLYYRHIQSRRGVLGVVNYAWRSEEYETALHIYAAVSDLRRLQHALPDIDAMTRTITIVPGTRKDVA